MRMVAGKAMGQLGFSHTPVLLGECIEGLAVRPGGCYLDGTAGGGGHSEEIAKRISENGRLFCLDKDPAAVAAVRERLSAYPNTAVIEGDFRDAKRLLAGKAPPLDGALLDLGVSSYQLDAAERGFSCHLDGALDMRMSQSGTTAAEIVNTAGTEELTSILRDYGEERYAPLIARKIVARREEKPIGTTLELADIIRSSLPSAARRKERDPARKSFMALRIAANDELNALREGLEAIFGMMAPGARFAVISFHSVEDRIVKRYFSALRTGCTCPPEFPVCVCGKKPRANAVTKKPVAAPADEVALNRRARSAKLRIIEKC